MPDYKRTYLTKRETEVLLLIAEGYTIKEIGVRLHVREATAKSHAANARAKLGASNSANMIHLAWLMGLFTTTSPSDSKNLLTGYPKQSRSELER